MMQVIKRIFLLTIVTIPFGNAAFGQQWGDLTATFVYDGAVPTPDKVVVTKDIDFCGKHNLVDNSLVVNPENKGIANLVVYLYLSRSDDPPAVHPSFAETAMDKVLLDNSKCAFDGHVTLLRTSQTLVLGNSDPVGHNSKIDTFTNAPINVTIPAGAKVEQKFPAAERLPTKVSCSIHPWMEGWIVIKDNPYMAATDKNGKFTIKNLPAGEWTFQFWHEKAGYVDEVVADGKDVEWTRGRLEVNIKPGTNDLGEFKIKPSVFED